MKKYMLSNVIAIALAFSLLVANTSVASVKLDEAFLNSTTGNSSVSLQVEQLIEMIKNVKLSDGRHPKILGWQRSNNLYTFTFIADMKVTLRFQHLINQGGKWSSITAYADGQQIDPIALIMQIYSMPRSKTKFDLDNDKAIAERERQEEAERTAAKKKQEDSDAIIREAKEQEWLASFKDVLGKAFGAADPALTPDAGDMIETIKYYSGKEPHEFNSLVLKAKTDDPQAMYDLAMVYKPIESYEYQLLFVKWIFLASKKHHPAALYEKGMMLKLGNRLIPKNEALARSPMLESAKLGYAKAQTQCALDSLDKKDFKTYRDWLLKSSAQGDLFGMYLLGSDYLDGKNGIEENLREGIKLLKLCAALRNKPEGEKDAYAPFISEAERKLDKILGN